MTTAATPMLRQYHRIKNEHPDKVVMFRMGDFYEMFYEDAVTASRVLNITLTKRGAGGGETMPLAGIPYHQLDAYLSKFIRAGYKVAIAEQTEDPKKAKGLVRRDVVRVATPGTITESSILDERRHNFLVSIYRENGSAKKSGAWGVAVCDMSTGRFEITEMNGGREGADLLSELCRLQPAEILVPASERDTLARLLDESFRVPLTALPDDDFGGRLARERLSEQLQVHDLSGFGAEELNAAPRAAGALIGYLRDTQKSALEHVNTLKVYSTSDYMILDATTQRSLELVENLQAGGRDGTLLSVIDHTITPMGARLLRSWLLRPLKDTTEIDQRLDAVDTLFQDYGAREDLRAQLKNIYDIERIAARINAGTANARDLVALRESLNAVPVIRSRVAGLNADLWRDLTDWLNPHDALARELANAIVDQPPLTIREGGLIRDGFDEQIDHYRSLNRDSKTWIAQMRQGEIERTGADKLKIGFNRVFGYYIEISKVALRDITIPENYIRKQTLVNAERFITPELKEREEAILHAEERCNDREYDIFMELIVRVRAHTKSLQRLAAGLAVADAVASLAAAAVTENYARPTMTQDGALHIVDGRHPVIEALDAERMFVANDCDLNNDGTQIAIITGPNMAGKSTYIRQVALITLMAHVGSFVPARSATIGLVDRIFTRVGAMDALTKGQSTFLVEMSETANILNNATDRSLVILDEIGRGTSTYDGLAIAWSVVEYLLNHPGCNPKTLFATHYHQLIDLEGAHARVRNFNVAVDESEDHITFLYKIVAGGTDRSYGIYAAQLAGLPPEAVQRARELLFDLEVGNAITVRTAERAGAKAPKPATDAIQLNLFEVTPHPTLERLRGIEPNNLTPLQALALLAELVREVK